MCPVTTCSLRVEIGGYAVLLHHITCFFVDTHEEEVAYVESVEAKLVEIQGHLQVALVN